jgi:hypothetical protein
MTWDFGEVNIFSGSGGSFLNNLEYVAKAGRASAALPGTAVQADASNQRTSIDKVVSTDPPYYDNVGYADLSDFFYVWLRRSLQATVPDLFATVAVPKREELVATRDPRRPLVGEPPGDDEMSDPASLPDPADRLEDLPRILRAMTDAVRQALWRHKQAGNPVAVWRNGRVEWIAPEDIPVAESPARVGHR